MSSNAPWNNQLKTRLPATTVGQTDNSSSWNQPVVNTPQTNPASWPQLGATAPEQPKQPQQSTSLSQLQERSQQVTNSSSDMSNAASNNDTTLSGSSAWGRLPDTKISQPSTVHGWGAPSTGAAWGQNQSSGVDDGTAVWGKSASTQQHQGNWGGPTHVTQGTEPTTTAVGWSEPTSSSNNQGGNSATNTQPQASSSPVSSGTQPVTWAKAASAGLTSNAAEVEAVSAENEPETSEPSMPPVPQPPVLETDPVQKLVNSHEGWGKKPIQQGTSWNISDPNQGLGRPLNNVNNGTEAWGKAGGGQMPPSPCWNASSANKQPGNWGNNFSNSPAAPAGNWGVPTQQQQQPRPSFVPGNSSGASGWGNPQQQQQPGPNNSRWNDMSGQSSSNPSNWGTPQNPPGNPGWGGGGMPSNSDNNSSSNWGNAPPRPGPQSGGWGNNMMPQSSSTDPSTCGRSSDPRRPNTVNDGTSAWGDPGAYSKVTMWDRSKGGPNNSENVGGQLPNVNSQVESKGWGALPNQPPNRLPSPKGWGDLSPTQPNMAADNGSSGWGAKPMSAEKWDKGNGQGNWNVAKPNTGGWGQPNDQQWNTPDGGSNWGPQLGKNDNMMKNNMDYGPRGGMPPQQTINPQMMLHNNQMPPALPPQLSSQFHQIRQAVMNGLLPGHLLNPHVMTPQRMHSIIQFLNKTSEIQKMQMKMTMLSENKAIPHMQRQQQIDQYTRAIRQCQQQIEAQKAMIMQNLQQQQQSNLAKPQPNMGNKMNGPAGRMDLGGARTGPGGQSMVSPLNNMNPLSQALPSTLPLPTMASPREQKSRFINNFMYKLPNNFGPMGDNPQQPNPSNMGLGMGPGGDAAFNGMPYRSNVDDFSHSDNGGMPSAALPTADLCSSQSIASNDQPGALTDIGPPEFTPGVPWKGFRHIDPESDPNITPGSVASAKTMSINTVRDADQVLSRDRSAQAEVSPSDGREDATSLTHAPKSASETNSSQIWSIGANGTTSGQPSAFRPPKELAPSWGGQQVPGGSWDQQSQPMPDVSWSGASQDVRGSWLVLTNFNQQVDPVYVQTMCAQHGTVLSFQPHCPMEGTALVKYRSPDEAISAKKALNMCMVGSTMLVATVATDRDVNNFMTATGGGGGSWSSNSAGGNRHMSSSESTGGFMGQAPPPRPNLAAPVDGSGMLSSGNAHQFWGSTMTNNAPSGASWPTNASPNVAWSGATGEDISRIMSPIHSLLPENLLGGETL